MMNSPSSKELKSPIMNKNTRITWRRSKCKVHDDQRKDMCNSMDETFDQYKRINHDVV